MIERLARNPLLLALALVVAAALGAGLFATAQALTPASAQGADKAKIEQVVHAYLLEHPEILPEAMERLHAQRTADVIAANRAAVLEPFGDAWEGNPHGDVSIVAYMDYACGYCRATLPDLKRLLARDAKVRVVYRELPILSQESEIAARWALAAAEQGKYKPFHDALFAEGRLSEASLEHAIAASGLDRARAEAAAKSPRVVQEIATNQDLAGRLGMTGTPSWVIGNSVVSGVQSYDQLAQAVAAARRRN